MAETPMSAMPRPNTTTEARSAAASAPVGSTQWAQPEILSSRTTIIARIAHLTTAG